MKRPVSIATKLSFMQNMKIRQPLLKMEFQAIYQKAIDLES